MLMTVHDRIAGPERPHGCYPTLKRNGSISAAMQYYSSDFVN